MIQKWQYIDTPKLCIVTPLYCSIAGTWLLPESEAKPRMRVNNYVHKITHECAVIPLTDTVRRKILTGEYIDEFDEFPAIRQHFPYQNFSI